MKPPRSQHLPNDVLFAAGLGAFGRPLRAALSLLGIALGVAALVAIVGISDSNRAHLDERLRALGPDLLVVHPGQTLDGKVATLPAQAPAMIERIAPVREVAALGTTAATVRRSDLVPSGITGGLDVSAATPRLAAALNVQLTRGRWPTEGPRGLPEAVLGSSAARHLGITRPGADSRVFIAGRYFTVVGVLPPVALAQEVDNSVLVSWNAAAQFLAFDGHPTSIFVRSSEAAAHDVRAVLPDTANPVNPGSVVVTRPSDALAAKAATDSALNTLVLLLAGIGLLIGGIGVANTMVVAVLERRTEVGLRRALGATRGHIAGQFLTEAAILSVTGGVAGSILGMFVAGAVSVGHGWPVAPPWLELGVSLLSTVVIGLVAGLYPAVKAARQAPTAALTGA